MANSMDIDREYALELIKSPAPNDRLMAARFFSVHSSGEDKQALQSALDNESVPLIKRVLTAILTENKIPVAAIDNEIVKAEMFDARRQMYSQALNETASLLLHEIAPHLGFIRLDASKEIDGYETSKTKRSIDDLNALLRLIYMLRSAANAINMEQLDLATLIRNIIGREGLTKIELAGPVPFLVAGDSKILDLAITNGIRNAVEASDGLQRDVAPIVINWDCTDRDYWISIIDDGRGFSGNPERAFGIGTTSKSSHFGMGLPIAQQMLNSLGGEVRLQRRDSRGTQFEIRWPKTEI
jgi:signal transduction histidine kinase